MRRANTPKCSGFATYSVRPSTDAGMPAFGCAMTGLPRPTIPVTTWYSSAGPTRQFAPITSAPAAIRRSAISPGPRPPSDFALSSNTIIAITGTRGPRSLATSIAVSISRIDPNVSRTIASTPASTSVSICSASANRASLRSDALATPNRTPVGPTAPETYARSPAALRAISTAARLIALVCSARPCRASAMRFEPNVFVSMTSAPACT